MKKIVLSRMLPAVFAVIAAFSLSLFQSHDAQAGKARVEVGTLKCKVHSGTNFIVGSTKTLYCRLVGVSGTVIGRYSGKMDRFGIDIGKVRKARMAWVVIAPTRGFKSSSLHGRYIGVAADASLGLGGGAKVLVGGSRKTITLQPVALQAQKGINLALTVAGLTLSAR